MSRLDQNVVRSSNSCYPETRNNDAPGLVREVSRLAPMPRVTVVIRSLDVTRAAERLGERERATRGYQFVLDTWRHADPELQRYVAEALQALERAYPASLGPEAVMPEVQDRLPHR